MPKRVLLLVSVAFMLSSCGLQKMVDEASKVKYKVQPNPLESHAEKVKSRLLINFPAKYFHKKAIVTITPVLRAGNDELELEKVTLKGESVTTNSEAQVINNTVGGNVDHEIEIDYDKTYSKSELVAKISATDGKKEFPFGERVLAKGIINSIELVENDEKVILAYPLPKGVYDIQSPEAKTSKENVNLTQEEFELKSLDTKSAKVLFLKNKHNLRRSQKNSKIIKEFKKIISKYSKEGKDFVKAEIVGSASPEGPVDLNTELSNKRTNSTKKFYTSILKKSGIKNVDEKDFITYSDIEEDWKGFRNLVLESDLENKDLIISILDNYTDVNERELELKKMTKTFIRLEKDILPVLRNSKLVVSYFPPQKSDEDIKRMALSSVDSLNSEEILYAMHIEEGLDNKKAIAKNMTEKYPEDWRGFNNLACIEIMENDLLNATNNLNKAASLTTSNGIVSNNLGVISRWGGDVENAELNYNAAKSYGENGKELKYNQAVISMFKADYSKTIEDMGEAKTLNSVLVRILDKNYVEADTRFSSLPEELSKSEKGNYLNAIINSNTEREEQAKTLIEKLSNSSELAERAKTDLEFIHNR